MQFKIREVEVDEVEPFKNDKLDRKESAEILTDFVCSSSDPMVICIDALWGQGKTTFLRMWEQHLKNKDIPTLYFNAWENDFTDDAFVALIGEIGSAIDNIAGSDNKSKIKASYEKTKDLGKVILKRSVPVAAKLLTAGVLDFDKQTELALSAFAESVASEQIDKYESAKKTLVAFRKNLAEFAATVSDDKPLIFIIDELDRCRPNFAIEILEKAKHFFNVPNIIFVLGADKEQLGHSVKAVYGIDCNVNGYLRRFIDFDYLLPTPEKGRFIKALFEKYEFDKYFLKRGNNGEKGIALDMFTKLFELYQLTLREQVHCCSLLNLSLRTTPCDKYLYPLFLCLLIVLKVKQPQVYKQFINTEISPAQLLEMIKDGDKKGVIFNDEPYYDYGWILEAHIIVSCTNPITDEIKAPYQRILESESSTSEEKLRSKEILRKLRDFNHGRGAGCLDYLVKKLEIASRFSDED